MTSNVIKKVIKNGVEYDIYANGGAAGAGDVSGPASATSGHLAVFDGTTGKQIKDGGAVPTVPTNVSAFTNDAGYTTNTGTITSVKMNGSTVSSSGEADLGTVITSHQSIKTLNSTSLVGTGDVTVNEVPSSGTTGHVLTKTSNGYGWAAPSGGISNDTTGTTTTVTKIRAGTETEYTNLSSKNATTIYYVF